LNACMNRQETTANILQMVIRHHVTLRRN
jgi:hypothetical protein